MSLNYVAIKNEIVNDPMMLGYAGKDDQTIANMMNSTTGGGAAIIDLKVVDKDSFVLGIAPQIYANLSSLTAAKQQQWRDILGIINGASAVDVSSANAKTLLSQAVTDGVLTQAQVNAVTQRIGSRAEVVFGAGTMIGFMDVAKAMGR